MTTLFLLGSYSPVDCSKIPAQLPFSNLNFPASIPHLPFLTFHSSASISDSFHSSSVIHRLLFLNFPSPQLPFLRFHSSASILQHPFLSFIFLSFHSLASIYKLPLLIFHTLASISISISRHLSLYSLQLYSPANTLLAAKGRPCRRNYMFSFYVSVSPAGTSV